MNDSWYMNQVLVQNFHHIFYEETSIKGAVSCFNSIEVQNINEMDDKPEASRLLWKLLLSLTG